MTHNHKFGLTQHHLRRRRGEERGVCFYVCERDTARGESWTTHPEDSEAQDSQPILLTCHTAPALGKALPNCSAC
ncbi:hypothetical protein CgunFtcFv8_021799 [Champsocephalus gunnari]|uniref:Uncharacterized protein n=1 Tax=Champsocephalus gunnari TaxID=52237 RepID=A0AAN8DPN6_CHAGU|nr:hypothetical protein CgunFtcFv8_021799 [Champsocephalus gunnari]